MMEDPDHYITTKTELLSYLGDFIDVVINMILYTREVYPATIFSRVMRFNAPVFITNYDKLHDYIRSINESVQPILFQDNLRQLSVVICTKKERIALEKMTLRLSSLNPIIVESFKSKSERIEPIEKASLEKIMRSFLVKLSTSDTYFKPLPQDITFYVLIETVDDLNPLSKESIQHAINGKFPWILANTEDVTAFEDSSLIPLKSLDSEVFKFELVAQEINK